MDIRMFEWESLEYYSDYIQCAYVIVLRKKPRITISVLSQKLEKAEEMFLLLPLKC